MRKKVVGDYNITITFNHMRVVADNHLFFDRRVPRKGQPKEKWMAKSVSWMIPWPRGGKTFCHVRVKNNIETIGFAVAGVAVCSMSDTYDKHTGEILAARRAYDTLSNSEFGGPTLDVLVNEAMMMLDEYQQELTRKKLAKESQEVARAEQREKSRSWWQERKSKGKIT